MVVRKFYADTAREALRLVRDALGPHALILSNRRTAAGVEIKAVSEAEVASVTAGVAMGAMSASPAQRAAAERVATVSAPAIAPANPAPPADYHLLQEVRILRSMLEGQLAAFAWHAAHCESAVEACPRFCPSARRRDDHIVVSERGAGAAASRSTRS